MLEANFQAVYPLARRASQVRAIAAVRSGAVLLFEREDLEQEGQLACWLALPRFDPSRASFRTYIEHVVSNRMASLARARRCRPRLQSLDDNRHAASDAWAHEIELRTDVQRVLDALPETHRQIALALVEHTPSEASKMFGIARSTVYEWIGHLRVAFADAGLRPKGARRP
ncbi:MAG TPA: sigma-70 family RNA polymerase sigma factor [Bryobacteraceae bacterium]|nr:sigma-70 family RNA polymerase sigma factor [Bryobacteraceae bacterium]HPT26224.1 sigma-70 family RNA polymerase sigma factor [Bryobacteraceae bacterium]